MLALNIGSLVAVSVVPVKASRRQMSHGIGHNGFLCKSRFVPLLTRQLSLDIPTKAEHVRAGKALSVLHSGRHTIINS